jgi:hypothetical protein
MIAVSELAHGLLNPPAQQLLGASVVPQQGNRPHEGSRQHEGIRALPSAAPTPSPATSSMAAAPPAGGATQPATAGTLLTSADGTVTASCQPGGAYLQVWSPDQGFEADDVARGPATVASVTFEGSGGGVIMHVSCSSGTPVAQVTAIPPGTDDTSPDT